MKLPVPFIRTAYNYDRNAAGDETAIRDFGEGMTQQSFAEECDINTIVRRFGLTGELPSGVRMPSYGDFDSVVDFQTAMNALVQAKEAFMEMPADVRARFGNDPGAFVDFCSDKKNLEEARRLGLVPPAELMPDVSPGSRESDAAEVPATPVATPPQAKPKSK